MKVLFTSLITSLLVCLAVPAVADTNVTILIPTAVEPDFIVECQRISSIYKLRNFTNGIAPNTLSKEDCILKMVEVYMEDQVSVIARQSEYGTANVNVTNTVNQFITDIGFAPDAIACGDGIIDNQGANELCDDGVSNSNNAMCLLACEIAECGDEFVCNDPGCTTWLGGPEVTDDGSGICS